MKKIELRSKASNEFLEIPVDFIDTFMPAAPSDYVKVYLYLLRARMDPSILLSVNDMADLFDVTPNKVTQALTYWKTEGLLSLDFTDGEVSGITILPCVSASVNPVQPAAPETVPAPVPVSSLPEAPSAPVMPAVPAYAATSDVPPADAPLDLHSLDGDDAFTDLLSLAEFYLKKPITSTQRESLGFCYLLFDRQSDVIEYLLEYCIERGHFSFRYIEAVAKGWKDEGLNDLQSIRSAASRRNETVYSVMNAFGLGNRMPVREETDYIRRWSDSFELPIILEACSRTMSAIHTPSFKYADSILASWKKNGVRKKEDISVLDQKHQEQPKAAVPEKAEKRPNAFRNFEGRNTDYNALVARYCES